MKIIVILMFFLLFSPLFTDTGSVFYAIHIPDVGLSNDSVYPHYLGICSYMTTPMGQKVGWQGIFLFSTAQPAAGVISNIAVGLLIGQEVMLGPILLSIDAIGGLGISVSDFGGTAEHLTFYGEITCQLGAEVSRGIQICGFFGLQSIGNIIPGIPGGEFLYYSPVAGIRINFYS
ncbi:MAG: hypothetical protein JW969_20770 [Spirochaetales bacterium]|nr:hypothetical protein [Spirochaetales bacterium]